MEYKQLVQNKIGHIYHQFVEQKRKVSELADAPIKKSCWCGGSIMMVNNMKVHSNILKYDCNVCNFKTNNQKEFSDHIGWAVHRVAAMKKLKENL